MAKSDGNLLAQIEKDLLDNSPLSGVLRKVIVLGGRSNSGALRDWASRELNGYAGASDSVPDYRRVGAEIRIDAAVAGGMITGQPISVSDLPDFAREHIGEVVALPNSIAELESLVGGSDDSKPIRMPLPMAQDLARLMDAQIGAPHQQITGLYWAVSKASVTGVLDRIRTKLAELVAELIATMPDSQIEPTPEQAAAAVTFIVSGKRPKVSFANAQAIGGDATSTQGLASQAELNHEPSWWTLGRKVAAFIVGCCVIAGAVISYLMYIK